MSGGKGALIRDWNAETAALVSMTLDNLGISNILWGNMLLRLYGVPTIVDVWTSLSGGEQG
ncbi:hypothetical protein FH972_022906 [Carpinus fangiana]|uniref:Uncharacterized protein n=1 Tax=Carpinus fangiana TaxID=176857 RepID=A0A5N6KTZ7_9ROSI|nr:hypothetical protein FH972_022906 [Carpinus fangiana]